MDLWVKDNKLIAIEDFINGRTLDNVLINKELGKEQIIGFNGCLLVVCCFFSYIKNQRRAILQVLSDEARL